MEFSKIFYYDLSKDVNVSQWSLSNFDVLPDYFKYIYVKLFGDDMFFRLMSRQNIISAVVDVVRTYGIVPFDFKIPSELIDDLLLVQKLLTSPETAKYNVLVHYYIDQTKSYRLVTWNPLILPILLNPKRIPTYPTRVPVFGYNFVISSILDNIDIYAKSFIDKKDGFVEDFIVRTKNVAPSINGTACVGKTSILNNLIDKVKSAKPECAKKVNVLKLSKCGGVKGKDTNSLIGMQCAIIMMNAVESSPLCIADRCPFNNIIWQMIMSIINNESGTSSPREMAMYILANMNKNTLELMRSYPVVVIIDSDVMANRVRMYDRGRLTLENTNRSTGDLFRWSIPNYVTAQNLIYGAIAQMCEWPLFDVGNGKFPITQHAEFDVLETLIIGKCLRNFDVCKIDNLVTLHEYAHDTYSEPNFDFSKDVGIFK